MTADITDAASIADIISTAGPRIDGLANVAGIMDGFEPTADIDDATWDRVLSVNLTGMMRLTRAVLPAMLERGRGSIVNVGSEAGQRGSAAGTPYTTSKHAVNGFTARPDQLAAAITWLLSDDASNVSGAVLPVDGGWAAI